MAQTPAEKQKAYRQRLKDQEFIDLGLNRQPCPEDGTPDQVRAWAQGVWQAQSVDAERERQNKRRSLGLGNDSKERAARAERYAAVMGDA